MIGYLLSLHYSPTVPRPLLYTIYYTTTIYYSDFSLLTSHQTPFLHLLYLIYLIVSSYLTVSQRDRSVMLYHHLPP